MPLLMLLSLLGNMPLQIILPAMPSIQRTFNATPGGVQMLVSVSFFVFGFAMLIYGPLADSYGRRRVYIAGMLLYACGAFICAIAPNLAILLIGRAISSAGASVSTVLPRAIVRDVFAGHDTARMLARIAMVAALTPMIVPPIGGVISDLVGWRALFVVLCVVGLCSAAIIYFLLPETLRETRRGLGLGTVLGSFGALLRDRRFAAYAINGAFIPSVFFVFMTAAPFVYAHVIGLSASVYALYYMMTVAGFLIGYWIAARAAGRVSIDRMLVIASTGCVAAAAIALAVNLVLPWTVWSLTLPVILVTIASGVVNPNSQAAVVSGDLRAVGAASGLAGFLQMMVGSLLIQGVGLMPQTTPYPMNAMMVAAACVGLGAILWGVRGDNGRAKTHVP